MSQIEKVLEDVRFRARSEHQVSFMQIPDAILALEIESKTIVVLSLDVRKSNQVFQRVYRKFYNKYPISGMDESRIVFLSGHQTVVHFYSVQLFNQRLGLSDFDLLIVDYKLWR